jgi:hypothetical protein
MAVALSAKSRSHALSCCLEKKESQDSLEAHVRVDDEEEDKGGIDGGTDAAGRKGRQRQRHETYRDQPLKAPVIAAVDRARVRHRRGLVDAAFDHLWTWRHDFAGGAC